jgi:hypothetical protein
VREYWVYTYISGPIENCEGVECEIFVYSMGNGIELQVEYGREYADNVEECPVDIR